MGEGGVEEDIYKLMIWVLLFCGTDFSILLCRLLFWQMCSYCRFWNFPDSRSNGMYNTSNFLELFLILFINLWLHVLC